MGLNVKNYNIKYCKYLKKKYIPKTFKIRSENKRGEFINKKMIGFIPDKYIVLDIDTKDGVESADFLIDKIPKDTASEKTPNGYHYYFENDTEDTIHSYVQLDVGGEKYSVDILGVDSLVTMSPSRIEGKSYYWINSIFTHKPAKLSENAWILDLIKNNKPFIRKFDGFHLDINIKNAFIIIDNLHIESHFRFFLQNTKIYHKKIKLLVS
jgi:heat shock protein HspQ